MSTAMTEAPAPADTATPTTDLFIGYVYNSADGQPFNRAWRVTGTDAAGIKRMRGIFDALDPDVKARYAAPEAGSPDCATQHRQFRAYMEAVGIELEEAEYGSVFRTPGFADCLYSGDRGIMKWD